VLSPGAEATEEELVVEGVRVFVRRTGGEGVPTLFVHGNPTHSEDWQPFLGRLQGPAIALDLPGWGRSEKPSAERFDYSMHGLAVFLGRFLEVAGIETYQLVCHDWGGLSLITAQADPGRLEKLVVINAVPLLPGYRWHWIARWFWRVRGMGEVVNALTTRPALRLISRQSTAKPGPLPPEFIEMVWRGRPAGAWPQMLALYRSAPEEALAAAGQGLGTLDCPALVVWGAKDIYIPVRFGRLYAERLPRAELLEVPHAGHWPWIDEPSVVDSAVAFLDG
jgi:pimeloyl-ACP methyl ester carboxylesterase